MSISAAIFSLVKDIQRVVGWRLPMLVVLTFASALFEGLTLAALLPLLAVLGFGASAADSGRITFVVVRVFTELGVPFTMSSVGALLLILLAASAVVFLIQAYFVTRLQSYYVAYWQKRALAAVLGASWQFLRVQRTGDIIAGLSTEAARLGGAFYQANLIASSITFLAVQMAIAAIIAPLVTAAMLVLSVALFAITRSFTRRALAFGAELTQANAEMLAAAGEMTQAMKLIKATAQEEHGKEKVVHQVERIETLSFKNSFDVQIVRAVFEYMSGAGVALLLIASPLLLGVDIAAVLVVVAIFLRLFPKVTGLRQCVQSISLVLPAFESLCGLASRAEGARETAPLLSRPVMDGPAAIRFDHVGVYGELSKSLLSDICLDIAPGQFIAVVGPTGAGKTTLIDCVLDLATVDMGEVLIDGVPLREISRVTWRRATGYLGQDPILFSGTIRDNVAWGRDGVDDEAIAAALKAADAGFVLGLVDGLDTVVGDRGGVFSGGERQRIALARALVGHPRLLILDEATSALDVETERQITDAIYARRGQATIIAITHRIAAVRSADVIVMLETGRIVERGSFNSLLAANGRFSTFWRSQFKEENEGSAAR